MYSAKSTQVPEKTLISVQRPITQVWKQLLGQVWAVISFHLSPRSLGLCKSISEKITSEVGYPNAKTVKQYTKTLWNRLLYELCVFYNAIMMIFLNYSHSLFSYCFQIIGNHNWESISWLQTRPQGRILLVLNGDLWELGYVTSGQWDSNVSPSQVGLRTLGLGLDTSTAGHSLLVVNICDTIMSSFAIG